jgi:hypothetical protein
MSPHSPDRLTSRERLFARIDEIRHGQLIELPNGESFRLPLGHRFQDFTPDGKVISTRTSVEIHTPTEQSHRWKAAAVVSAGRATTRAAKGRCQIRQRRGSSGRPRMRRTARRAAGTRAGPDDGPGEPPGSRRGAA